MAANNYYEILNVPHDANNKTICEAYKKMALKWHPDKNPDNKEEANQRFLEISQAYQVLSDDNKRMRYDQGHMDHDNHDFSDDDDEFFGDFFEFISPEILFRHFFEHLDRRGFRPRQYFNNERDDNRNKRRGDADGRQHKKDDFKNHFVDECHTRMVNGKQWMTKTSYENGNKIVTRYEDGELISKQINGVSQTIKK